MLVVDDDVSLQNLFKVFLKKIGFSRPTDRNPNAGEVEGQLLLDRHWGSFVLAANGVFGKSLTAPDSDDEVKLTADHNLLRHLLNGLDSINRLRTTIDV